MFEFQIVTIFPELFDGFVKTSLMGKAREKDLLSFNLINLRDFTSDRHNSVDDSPYGGGSGMVMKPEPIYKMFNSLPDCHKILMTPQGSPFTQKTAARLALLDKPVMLFCGRYEGIDERACQRFDEQICLGDFVLNGGEVAAMAVIEAVSRLVPGVIGNAHSTVEESFSAGTIEYPQYTRPEIIEDEAVPPVLLSGNHAKIEDWRRGQSLLRTRDRRPDLFVKLTLDKKDKKLLAEAIEEENPKKGKTIET